MTQEEKDLLLKDICARLPYGVKVQYYDNETKKLEAGAIVSCTIPIDETNQKYPTFITRRDLLIIQGNTIEDIKPYLFPLSSMTDEQEEEYNNLNCWELGCFPHTEDALDYLIANHFDYRGLIEMGIAIDATGLDVYE